jgi:tetratricopeptide (TPR) repeat protein
LATGWQRADRSSDTWARDYAERLLKGLEPGALLFAEEDNVVFPLSYLHHVEGLRPDVELVMQGINRLDAVRIRPEQRPVYLTHPRDLGRPALATHPDGLAFRLLPAGLAFEGRPWTQVALDSFEAIREPGSLRYLDRSLAGNYYFSKALNLETIDPAGSLEAIRRLERISFDNDVNLVNAGLMHERSGRLEEAGADFERAASIEAKNDLAVTRARLRDPQRAGARD